MLYIINYIYIYLYIYIVLWYIVHIVCVCAMLLFERASMQMTYQNQHGKNPRRGPPSRCRRCWTKLAMASGLTLETSLEGLQVPATSNTVTGEGSWEQPCWGWCISKSICRTLSMKSNVPHKHVITPEIWRFAIGTAPKKFYHSNLRKLVKWQQDQQKLACKTSNIQIVLRLEYYACIVTPQK